MEFICTDKKCLVNGVPQSLSVFNKDIHRKDGYYNKCKVCHKRNAGTGKRYATKHTAKDGFKLCSNSECMEINPQPISAFSKHIKNFDSLNHTCKSCNRKYNSDNSERNKIRDIQYHLDNKEYRNKQSNKWSEDNREHKNKCQADYARKNRGICNAQSARYRSAKLQRTVAWSNSRAMKKIYQECRTITLRTGIDHHVDHIVPLQGKNVSGLHVENNLQIIPATDNLIKNNSFTPTTLS